MRRVRTHRRLRVLLILLRQRSSFLFHAEVMTHAELHARTHAHAHAQAYPTALQALEPLPLTSCSFCTCIGALVSRHDHNTQFRHSSRAAAASASGGSCGSTRNCSASRRPDSARASASQHLLRGTAAGARDGSSAPCLCRVLMRALGVLRKQVGEGHRLGAVDHAVFLSRHAARPKREARRGAALLGRPLERRVGVRRA